ncbi:MAG: ATP-binding protein [Candidatus Melainabacteria bacterium]
MATLPSWLRATLLLGVLNLVTIAGAMFLIHSSLSDFNETLNAQLQWDQEMKMLSALAVYAGEMDEPGNRVFEDRDATTNRKAFEAGYQAFLEQIDHIRHNSTLTNDVQYQRYLESMRQKAGEMADAGARTFLEFQRGNETQAAVHMARLDIAYTSLLNEKREMENILRVADTEKKRLKIAHLEEHRHYEYLILFLLLLVVVGVSRYGYVMAKTFLKDNSEREVLYMTIQEQSEQLKNSLKETEEIRQALDVSTIVAVTDVQGNISYVNDTFCEISGYTREEVLGQNHRILNAGYHPREFFENMWHTIARGGIWRGEVKNKAKNGGYYWVDSTIVPQLGADGKPKRYIAIRHDITALKEQEELLHLAHDEVTAVNLRLTEEMAQNEKMQHTLLQAQKMDAIGTLTGGIAHDFNNILWMIIGNSELLLNTLPDQSLEHEIQRDIHCAAERGKGLVQQLLDFSRGQKSDEVEFSVSMLAKETMKLIRSTIPTTIDLEVDLRVNDLMVSGDPNKMHQVLMNLLANAYHAIGSGNKGRISVTVDKIWLSHEAVKSHAGLRTEGDYAVIQVSDSGSGISPDIIENIFEPFFTTKAVGQGTGLGLSTCLGIIKDMKGSIEVSSELDQGTTFSICLPVSADRGVFSAVDDGHFTGHSVLVVDDEPAIRMMLQRMLENMGNEVTVVENGQQALNLFRQNPKRFDLILTDHNMPELTGIEMSEKIHDLVADVPIVMTTGYRHAITAEQLEATRIRHILDKPVNAASLEEVLSSALSPRVNERTLSEVMPV